MSADLMRRFLDIVEDSPNLEDVFTEAPGRRMLAEGEVLNEGAIADRIKAAMAKVSSKFGNPSPVLLTQALQKARSLYSGSEPIRAVLDRVSVLGRSPKLLMAMIGICGLLISMAPNPAAAEQAAVPLAKVISAKTLDRVAADLEAHGIRIAMCDTQTSELGQELGPIVVRVASALRAIVDAEIAGRTIHSSTRELVNIVAMVEGVESRNAEYKEKIALKTPDGALTIAEITTSFKVTADGAVQTDYESTGLKFDLFNSLDHLTTAQQRRVDDYIHHIANDEPGAAQGIDEAASGELKTVALLHRIAPKVCDMVNTLAVRNGRVARYVEIGPGGVKVS